MNRICLTQEQKLELYLEKQYGKLTDGLAAFKNREHLTLEQMAGGIGTNRKVVTKLLNGEETRLDVLTFFKVLRVAGLKVVPVEGEVKV